MNRTFQITWSMGAAVEGVDADPMNPLARACRNLLQTGQRIEKLALSFVKDPTTPDEQPIARWFGVFVYTEAGSIIFFPGYARMPDELSMYRGTLPVRQGRFAVDHITLERDRVRWHVTGKGSKRCHQGGPTTLDLGDVRRLWFGYSIATANDLRLVKTNTIVTADIPSSDAERRIQVLMDSINAADDHPAIHLPHMSPVELTTHYMHFSVIAGPVGFGHYPGTDDLAP
jgi:hypothetical protein